MPTHGVGGGGRKDTENGRERGIERGERGREGERKQGRR